MSRNVSLAQLRADIQDQADVAGLTTRHTASLINRRINQSIQRFRERISLEGCQHYLTNTTGLFTAGATSPYPFYALDLSAAAPAIVRTYAVDITVGNVTKTLIHVPFQDRDKFSGPAVTGEPVAWANYQTTGVAIMPAPDSAYAYCVWHLPVLPDLSADSDTFNGVAGWEEFIVWDVVCHLIVRDQHPQAYAMAESSKQGIWRDIVRSATKVALAGGRTIGRDSFGEKLHGLNASRPYRWGGR
jgi:hypothetical protein